MSDIYQHLGLKRDIFDHFALQASLVVDNHMKSDLERHTRVLTKITERYLTDSEAVASKDSIDKVLLKVKRLSKLHDETYEWSLFELRIISYNLGVLQDSATAFRYSVQMLDKHWRNLFFGGVTFYVLDNWLAPDATKKDAVCELLKRKLEEYDGDNRRVLSLKNHANYFDSNGPLRLATLLSQRNKTIMEAPELLDYKGNAISFSYFSDVILQYFFRDDTFDIPKLDEVLTLHTLDRTKKLALANLVFLAEKEGVEYMQTQVVKFAQRILGDIALPSTWTPFPNASYEEKEQLLHAQALVNLWNARKAINTFFELCVQDVGRKEFWLKYANCIYDFRIAGSKAVYTKLIGDWRISDIISHYFLKTNSQSGRTSALILYIRDKVFIEFSDSGAIYVYEKDHWKIRNIRTQQKVSAIEDLKAPYFDKLVENYGEKDFIYDDNDYYYYKEVDLTKFNDEGKMFHIGHWDERLHAWIKEKLQIDYKNPNNNYYSYSDYRQNEGKQGQKQESSVSSESTPIAVSKIVFDGRCKLEAYNDGIYIRLLTSQKLVLITKMNCDRGCSLWLKKDRSYFDVYYNQKRTPGSDESKYIGFLSHWDFKDEESIRFHPLGGDKIIIPL